MNSLNSLIDSYEKFNQSFTLDLENLQKLDDSILLDFKIESPSDYYLKCKNMLEDLMNSFPEFSMSPEMSSNSTQVLIKNREALVEWLKLALIA